MLLPVQQAIRSEANAEKAVGHQRFFKTGKGEYGEGDTFLGLTVPQLRIITKKFRDVSRSEIKMLLASEFHEERLAGLLILVDQFQRGDAVEQESIATFYLAQTKAINNWDLVDSSADKILGAFLYEKDVSILFDLARSHNLWEQRIAIVATYYFIRKNKFDTTLQLAEIFLCHPHDLIHKAVGWMLREVGKRDLQTLEVFLKKHAHTMPRTMLRYAIEKMDERKRKLYMGLPSPPSPLPSRERGAPLGAG